MSAIPSARVLGFWPALLIAPIVVGILGALFERLFLRKVYKFGHVPELLITFGLSYVIVELVQLIWGRLALDFSPPELLQGPVFTLVSHSINGLSLLWGAAPAQMCSAAETRRALGLFAVSGHTRLHDAGGRDHAGRGLAAAHAHPHRPRDPGSADASAGGRGARA